jgi:hypothetical protein
LPSVIGDIRQNLDIRERLVKPAAKPAIDDERFHPAF